RVVPADDARPQSSRFRREGRPSYLGPGKRLSVRKNKITVGGKQKCLSLTVGPRSDERPVGDDSTHHRKATQSFYLLLRLSRKGSHRSREKGIFSTNDLIENAENAIPKAIRDAVPAEALDDWKQAGKCIVFELPTAAGFHLIRATEAVIRK